MPDNPPKKPKKNPFTIKKYDGDDIYSYAVFLKEDVKGLGYQIFYGDATPVASGENRACAAHIRDNFNSKHNKEHNLD